MARVSQFLAIKEGDDVYPKELLSKELKQIKAPNFELGQFRDTPPAVLADLHLPIYITTNYDHFIEEALESRGMEPVSDFCRWSEDLVEYAKENEINPTIYAEQTDYRPTSSMPLVYHLYGDMYHPQSMVLTEKDYIDFVIFLNKEDEKKVLPHAIRKQLNLTKLLFVGYGLDEAGFSLDFSVIFQTVLNSRDPKKLKGVCVQLMMPSINTDTNTNTNTVTNTNIITNYRYQYQYNYRY